MPKSTCGLRLPQCAAGHNDNFEAIAVKVEEGVGKRSNTRKTMDCFMN
jgi:hypothetical protein